MREDALEVLARNKTDLLKSISHNIDFGEEAGHYLLSVENIMRSDINSITKTYFVSKPYLMY